MSNSHQRSWLAVLALLVCLPAARAQKPGQIAGPALEPFPPLVRSESSSRAPESAASDLQADPDRAMPQTEPLTGGQPAALGTPGQAHNFLLPGFTFSQQIDTNGSGTAEPRKLTALSYLLGNLALERTSRRSQLALNYTGGGSVANNRSDLNSVIQELSAAETIRWRRSTLLLSDEFFYLPESSFGFPGFGASGPFTSVAGSPAGVLSTLQPPLAPSQTILTGHETRITNTFLGQVNYQLNPRASVTALGAYGFLHFSKSGFLNGYNATFQSGYNYALTAKDTIAVLYRFNAFGFRGSDSAIDDHIVQILFGRRIRDRLALRLAAGPEIDTFRLPGTGTGVRVLWSVDSSLSYRFGRNQFDLSYLHGLTGGAGVLSGAETNVAQVTVNRNLNRAWHGVLGVGYARNQSLTETTPTAASQTFNAWFGRVELNRSLGSRSALFLAYTARYQNSNARACMGLNCGPSQVRHLISLGLNWGARPIALE